MFRNLHISTKVFLILAPLLVVTFGAVVYFTYTFQEQQVLRMAQLSAESQASIIKKSLVHMMQTQEEVDDSYLRQISASGEIENLQIIFHLDSLHLKEQYLTPFRVRKLQRRQAQVGEKVSMYASEVFSGMQPVWSISCDSTAHDDLTVHAPEYRLTSLEEGIPNPFWTCGKLRIIQPFTAERKCQQCHQVEVGTVLGAASMDIPIGQTVTAIQDNAVRSISIFLVLVGAVSILGTFIFRRFVAVPVEKLVEATKTFKVGSAQVRLQDQFENDEFGELARSFDDMQLRLKEAQDKVIERERLSTIGQMASGIIHDFRNPMTNISVGLQVLESQRALNDDKRKDLFRTIRDSVDRMVRMTQELLEFARGETRLQYQQVEIDAFAARIEQIIRPSIEKSGVGFSISVERPMSCSLDPDRIERSIVNLINNADDVLNGKGDITLRVLCEDGKIVVFEVTDNGPGIPESIQATLFDPFVTMGKAKGTGLGLAITKRVVEQHGGTITFDTAPGKGTTFRIRIPNKSGQ